MPDPPPPIKWKVSPKFDWDIKFRLFRGTHSGSDSQKKSKNVSFLPLHSGAVWKILCINSKSFYAMLERIHNDVRA
jgi:hypothetical protein